MLVPERVLGSGCVRYEQDAAGRWRSEFIMGAGSFISTSRVQGSIEVGGVAGAAERASLE